MDKRDVEEYLKQLLKIGSIMLIVFGLPFIILASGKNKELLNSNLITFLSAMIYLIILVFSVIGLVYILTKIKRNKETLNTDQYIRELPKYFPPAIASFLLDLSVETTTDYTATIAYLISNKYIEFVDDKINILNNNIEKLSEHEKYVLVCLKKEKIFSHEEFKNILLKDAEKMNLIKKGKRKINFFRNFGITLLLCFIFSILSENVFKEGVLNQICSLIAILCEFSFFAVIAYSIYLANKYINESFHRTSLGEKEAIKWSGVKKYLKEYILISDKQLQHIATLENYIPYAIALNEASSIEKFIEENNVYRKLIYGNDIAGK